MSLWNPSRCLVSNSLKLSSLLRRHIPSKRLSSFSASRDVNYGADTIYALSSGSIGVTGVAVLRVSGPAAALCVQSLSTSRGKALSALPKPRYASLRALYCSQSGDMLDRALVLWFEQPKSFTGEDVAEFHLHGSKAVIASVFSALGSLNDASKGIVIRPAERGEFTRRAFENGKMDLTEIEGLADLLAAETAEQRKQALKQMDGSLKEKYDEWRNTLLTCLAHTEAVIDFGDDDRENDINDDALTALIPIVRSLRNELLFHLDDNRRGEIIREGVQVALVGQPNAGKSSLINALARRPAAIVSPIAGTTRDIVEVRMDIGGIPCIVRDTAGLRLDASDPIELEGIKRARQALDAAQIRVFVVDGSSAESVQSSLNLYQDIIEKDANAPDHNIDYRQIIVFNKADILSSSSTSLIEDIVKNTKLKPLPTSCLSGEGLAQLEENIQREINTLFGNGPVSPDGNDSISSKQSDRENVLITRERHRGHVQRCLQHLDAFLFDRLPMDAAAEEIRLAMIQLGKITGRVDVEELLDVIFRDFCIGK